MEQIDAFNNEYEKYKYCIKPNHEKFLAGLIDTLQDLRIFQAERKGNVTEEERKSLVAKERASLNSIEIMKTTIEKYLKETHNKSLNRIGAENAPPG